MHDCIYMKTASTLTTYVIKSFYQMWQSLKPTPELRFVLDMDETIDLPNAFRMADAQLSLNCSGSGQFSITGFEMLKKKLPEDVPLYVLDLRQESHGFANQMAVSWYGYNNAQNASKTLTEIEQDEHTRLEALLSEPTASIYHKKPPIKDTPFSIAVTSVATEEEFIKNQDHTYVRIPVTDHEAPSNEAVDQFIDLVNSLPEKSWLHIHCRKGKGRTTTFMTLLDMMRHAKKYSFDELIKRGQDIGGSNVIYVPKKRTMRYLQKLKRREFLKEFYTFCRSNDANFSISWQAWLETTKNASSTLNLHF